MKETKSKSKINPNQYVHRHKNSKSNQNQKRTKKVETPESSDGEDSAVESDDENDKIIREAMERIEKIYLVLYYQLSFHMIQFDVVLKYFYYQNKNRLYYPY